MKKVSFFIICICLLHISVLEAQERGVLIRPTEGDIIATEPGKIITTVARVTNKSGADQEFVLQVGIPESWIPITRSFPFRLKTDESDMQLISFMIPKGTPAGKYEITYGVNGTISPSMRDSYKAFVVVLPVTRLGVKVLDAPKYVIAGEEYTAVFAVTNESNTSCMIQLGIESAEKYPFSADANDITLGPGESRKVTVTVKTDDQRVDSVRHRLRLKATVPGKEKIRESVEIDVDIIPRTSGSDGRFHALPAEMSFIYVGDHSEGEHETGFQAQLSGSGTLDEAGKKHVSFLLRGPDLYEKSDPKSLVYGSHDEYRFNYWTDEYDITLGDQLYSLSPLTETSIYGRGAGGKLNLDSARIGIYHMQTRWFDRDEDQTAVFADYTVIDPWQIGVNFLKKKDTDGNASIASFESRIRPAGNNDINLEYAMGEKNDDAYSLALSGYSDLLAYNATYIHGDPDYRGCYNDLDFTSASITFPVRYRLRTTTSFRHEKRNLDLDPADGPASLENTFQTGVSYQLFTSLTLGLDWILRDRSDRLPNPGFDYREKTTRVSLSQQFNILSFFTSAEAGREKDRLTGNTPDVQRYTFSTYLRPAAGQSYGAYIYYDKDNDDSGTVTRRRTIGFNSDLQITGKTGIDFNFESLDYLGTRTGNRDIYSILLTHTIFRLHRISLQGRYIAYKDSGEDDQYAFMAQYTIPFDIPVSKKQSAGTVTGYIYDEETKKGISNVILKLNGLTTVTDGNGEFTFQSVKPGTYYLEIDSSKIGLDRISVEKTPMRINVEGGESNSLKLGMARSSTIKGRIVMNPATGSSNEKGVQGTGNGTYLVVGNGIGSASSGTGAIKEAEPRGLANVAVELENGSETLCRITDSKGRFEFEDLRPGKWKLKVNEENLPEYHSLADKNIEYDVMPGKTLDVSVKAAPKKRSIIIVEEKELPLEELVHKPGKASVKGEQKAIHRRVFSVMERHMPGKQTSAKKPAEPSNESGINHTMRSENTFNNPRLPKQPGVEMPEILQEAGKSTGTERITPGGAETQGRPGWLTMLLSIILAVAGVIGITAVLIFRSRRT